MKTNLYSIAVTQTHLSTMTWHFDTVLSCGRTVFPPVIYSCCHFKQIHELAHRALFIVVQWQSMQVERKSVWNITGCITKTKCDSIAKQITTLWCTHKGFLAIGIETPLFVLSYCCSHVNYEISFIYQLSLCFYAFLYQELIWKL